MKSLVISTLGLLFGFYGSGEAWSLAFRQRSARSEATKREQGRKSVKNSAEV